MEVTAPVVGFTVAIVGALLLHVLPATAGSTLSTVVSPRQIEEAPVMAGGTGNGFTVTTAVTSQVPTV